MPSDRSTSVRELLIDLRHKKMHGLWHKTHLHMRSRSLPIMTSSNKGGRYTILGLHWKKRPGRSYCISWLCKYMVSRGPQHCSYHLAHTVHNQLIRVFAHQYTVQLSSRHSLNRGIYSVISSNPAFASLTALSSPFAPELQILGARSKQQRKRAFGPFLLTYP